MLVETVLQTANNLHVLPTTQDLHLKNITRKWN